MDALGHSEDSGADLSLLTILQKGIKTADKIVKTLEADVSFKKYVRLGDGYTTSTFPYPAVTLRAIVEWKEMSMPGQSGVQVASRPTILFLDYAALMTATLGEGIKEEDKLVLADGTTGPIRTLDGFQDASTGKPIYTQVYLG